MTQDKYAEVLVDMDWEGETQKRYYYHAPAELLNSGLTLSSMVKVPFGKSYKRGIVIDIFNKKPDIRHQIKSIQELLHKQLFPSKYLKLLEWVGEYYLASLDTVVRNSLPLKLLDKFQERVALINENPPIMLTETQETIVQTLKESKNQDLALKYLKGQVKAKSFQKELKELIRLGICDSQLIQKKAVKKRKSREHNENALKSHIELNPEQKEVYNILKSKLEQDSPQYGLIRGITGSGKTEIYFDLIEDALKKGLSAIYLVPEIALSVQLLERIQRRFPEETIILWHSNLSDSERLTNIQLCLEEDSVIVLGARSAIFAPIEHLGVIIIDEEHDSSYRAGNYPYYDGRIIARYQAKLHNALLVEGSATPMVSTYYKAGNINSLYELTTRYNEAELPNVKIIDLREELQRGNNSIFSKSLDKAIRERIERQEQIILLHNRRGHSSYIFCRDCGYAYHCQHCSVPLIYHASSQNMICHQCDYSEPVPQSCPNCNSKRIGQSGLGTQKLEEEVTRQYPEAEIIRLDRDISRTRHGIEEAWERIKASNRNKAQILVGTQLIAKGFDLPDLTLVGIMQAEAGLHLPDYLAGERTFQLLTQVSGRAGRHQKAGQIILQTYNPEHNVIKYASQHDYLGYYQYEINRREQYAYPPFINIARIMLTDGQNEALKQESEQIADYLIKHHPSLVILGPAPCPIEKIKDKYRRQILIKSKDLKSIRQVRQDLENNLALNVNLSIELMPLSLI